MNNTNNTPCTATIRSISNPNLQFANARSGPGTSHPVLFEIPAGTTNLTVVQAKPDEGGQNINGKVYHWLELTLPDGRRGWVRDDLVQIIGDCSSVGYGMVWVQSYAFPLPFSQPIPVPASTAPTTPQPTEKAAPDAQMISKATATFSSATEKAATQSAPQYAPQYAPPPKSGPEEEERVRKAAFNITAAWEGEGYEAYQSYDAGIISYGRFQFTLAAGSLINIVNQYIERATSPTAAELRGVYKERLNAKDAGLKTDARLKQLLQEAAHDPIMQQIQDAAATAGFWQPVHDLSITPRGVSLPLGRALMFDMAINHGLYNKRINEAEDKLGVVYKSRVGENGVSEKDFIRTMAEVRRDFMYRFADLHNFGGLKRRGDFWVELVEKGDWYLQGDADGVVVVNGKRVQVRTP